MSDTTVFIPPHGRRPTGPFIPPLLVVPFVAYHIIALFTGQDPAFWSGQILSVPMVSGVPWSLTSGDLMLIVGLGCLFIEIVKSTNTGRASVAEHMLSTVMLIAFLVSFLLLGYCASSTFFLLMVMALVDVIAGFTVSITGAGRDVTMG